MIEGQDNRVERAPDGALIRTRSHDGDGMCVELEAALLEVVGRVSPVPVPRVLDVLVDGRAMVMEEMEGEALLHLVNNLDEVTARSLGDQLGRFLAALHRVDLGEVRHLVPDEPSALGEYHSDAVRILGSLGGRLSSDMREAVAQFVDRPVPAAGRERRLSHNDLGAEHVFVDPETLSITGIIDWSDASIGDPALDLGLILRDLGAAAFSSASAHVAMDDDVTARARFYARVKALEDFEFGFTSGRRVYLDNAVRSMRLLFP